MDGSRLKRNLLYPLLVMGVLIIGACSGETMDRAGSAASSDEQPSIPQLTDAQLTDAQLTDAQPVEKQLADPAAGGAAELSATPLAAETAVRILFLGDSITAGLGVELEQAFPALIQSRIDSLGYPALAVNAGLSGETTSGGLRRIEWLLRERIDILFLELGGNDGLRGIDLNVTEQNLSGIIVATRNKYPGIPVILAGMQIPPNLGHEYTAAFKSIFPRVAEKHDVSLVFFAPDGLGEMGDLLQVDGIHPNIEGHLALADIVWTGLEPVLSSVLDHRTSNK